MKRGLITWDPSEIPAAAFNGRLDGVRRALRERDLAALVIYSDMWRSNQARFFSNFMPYFNRAMLIISCDTPQSNVGGVSQDMISIARLNQARFFSNFMPYFNRAMLIISCDTPPTLLCGLSPRVYGWIRSVTII